MRHYETAENGRTFVRYKYEGTDSGSILIEKTSAFTPASASSGEKSNHKEFLQVPIEKIRGKKVGYIQVGSRRVRLTLNPDGRIVVKEIK